jgi:hypothetical protein
LLNFKDFDVVHHTCGNRSLGDANFNIVVSRCDDEIDCKLFFSELCLKFCFLGIGKQEMEHINKGVCKANIHVKTLGEGCI